MGHREAIFLTHRWPDEPCRTPAQVRLGHFGEALHVLAEIPDKVPCSLADGPNQRTWLLGDAFEMFFGSVLDEAYIELHVTPNGQRLQLRFPSEAAFRAQRDDGGFEEFLLPDPSFEAEAQCFESEWRFWAAVPSALVGEGPLAGQTWRFSFCRYDYDAIPGEPFLSSTSDYRELDFHRLADWGRMKFE